MRKGKMSSVNGLFALAAAFMAVSGLSAADLAPFPEWSAPRRITEGPKDHLLASYFAIDSWSPNKRYVSVLETELNGRLPEKRANAARSDLWILRTGTGSSP